MLVRDVLIEATRQIKSISDIPNKEARILLSFYLKKDQIWIITHDNENIEEEGYFKLISRREENEPIEYITNSASFYGKEFYVDSDVLIPRPETELLVDLVVSKCKGIKRPRIVEIGTGSGVISLMLKILIPNANITAIDISHKALEVAKINANKHALHVEFIQSDLCENFSETSFDVLVSNPPYIANKEALDVGLSYEPSLALYGGSVGDEILCKIIDIYTERNIKFLACEMGYDQRDKIDKYIENLALHVEYYKDLSNLDRGFVIERS